MRLNRPVLLGFAVCLAGCRSGTLPDPNDPKQVGSLSVDNLYGQYGEICSLLDYRQFTAQIDKRTHDALVQEASEELLQGFNLDKVDPSKAWQVARVMISAKHWPDAKLMLDAAVTWAKVNRNEDRRVNDTLKLAQVLANMNDVPMALRTARSTFNVSPGGAAPILYGVLLDLAPAARGKGHDVELAQMLEDAIAIDMKVAVDPHSQPGRDFIMGRPHHIRHAWSLIFTLYTDANRPDLLAKAQAAERKLAAPPAMISL